MTSVLNVLKNDGGSWDEWLNLNACRLVILMLFNGMLFYKLWCLESTATSLLKSKLYEHHHPAFSRQIDKSVMSTKWWRWIDIKYWCHCNIPIQYSRGELYLDKKMTEGSFKKSNLEGHLRNGMRSTKRRIWRDPDVDQWKNILVTSIRLMDHMRASLVELRNNIIELEQNNIKLKMKRGRSTPQEDGGAK